MTAAEQAHHGSGGPCPHSPPSAACSNERENSFVNVGRLGAEPAMCAHKGCICALTSFIQSPDHSFLCWFICLCVHSSFVLSLFLQSGMYRSSFFPALFWHLLRQNSLIFAICDACLARGVSAYWNAASPVLITHDKRRSRRLQALARQQV